MSGRIVTLLAIATTATGCALSYPPSYPAGSYTRKELTGEANDERFTPPEAIAQKIDTLVNERFPAPWEFDSAEADDLGRRRLQLGQQLYQKHCVHCHGVSGEGAGPTAPYLMPPPRDFRRGVFKWKSTVRPAKPTREDILTVLRNGALGTTMPPFTSLPDDQLEALTDYVIYLSQRGEFERQLLLVYSSEGPTIEEVASGTEPLNEEETEEVLEILAEEAESAYPRIVGQWEKASEQVVEPPADVPVASVGTPEFEESVARGREFYLGSVAGCAKCHGVDGRADPSMTKLDAKDVLDDWGNPNPPRNLTLGLYRGGWRPIDLYRRIHEGVAGSSMPGIGQNPLVTKSQIWDLANFLRALPVKPELLGNSASQVSADRVKEPHSVK